jgi:DNA excision repair protein ERCC-4
VKLKPENLIAIVDTREQVPFDLTPLKMEAGSLPTGDYSLKGLEHCVAFERKSLPDLVSCVGVHRERFERELHRLKAYESRGVIVEASWADLCQGRWKSKVTAASAVGSVLSWIEGGVPFLFAGSAEEASRATSRLLWFAANRRYKELRALSLFD